ncbi:hypothetical protein T07_8942 [Trichinella nelsoni]|uniref:Uncharacterized protein n=1 Tax=Trichinella nelsoni TaxID=6336 RepID=A0A0V0SEE0_9BILA|nr:hypothetical protein T07_8942 [Trichinella nelsoni]
MHQEAGSKVLLGMKLGNVQHFLITKIHVMQLQIVSLENFYALLTLESVSPPIEYRLMLIP